MDRWNGNASFSLAYARMSGWRPLDSWLQGLCTNCEIRFEFRASVDADSGFFVRGQQLQVRDYKVAGPWKDLKKYKPQDWNEIVIVV